MAIRCLLVSFLDYSRPFVYILSPFFPVKGWECVAVPHGNCAGTRGMATVRITKRWNPAVMKIQVAGLSEGVHTYHFEAPAPEIGLGDSFSRDVVVDALLEKTGTQLYVKAAISTAGTFECDRCLDAFEKPLLSTYTMYYLGEGSERGDLDPSEVQVLSPGTSVIDLTDDIRQTVLLSVPLKLLCRETCAGLCPLCGTNLNTGSCSCRETSMDPRWEKLRALGDRRTEGD